MLHSGQPGCLYAGPTTLLSLPDLHPTLKSRRVCVTAAQRVFVLSCRVKCFGIDVTPAGSAAHAADLDTARLAQQHVIC
jgi:hypothetical protein